VASFSEVDTSRLAQGIIFYATVNGVALVVGALPLTVLLSAYFKRQQERRHV